MTLKDILAAEYRVTLISVLLATVIFIAIASALIGLRIKSPAQIAAEASPPPASPIVVPVEVRTLTSDIVTRGTARYALPQAVTLAPSEVRPTEELITSLPSPSAEFSEGDVVFTVAGRPVFVMQGVIPAFRDMALGIKGEDVLQLERALLRGGFNPGTIDGVFTEQSASAVAAWYESSGWSLFETPTERTREIHAITERLAIAEKDLAVATLGASPKLVDATRLKAVSNNDAAQADVEAKMTAHSTIVADVTSSSEAKAKAEADLKASQSAVITTRKDGALAVLNAQQAQKVAQKEADAAKAQIALLSADLASLQSKVGVQVPAREIMFVPSLPAKIKQIDAKVGEVAKGPILTVASTDVVIDSSVQLSEASLVKPDMNATIDEPDLGITATGKITKVAEAPGTNGVDAFHVYIEISVDKTPTTLEGTSLRITIPVESTKGDVIVVPTSAISLAADGTSRVQVKQDDTLVYITVKTGLSAQGFVEVTPQEGSLKAGELVVVGFE